MGWRVLEVWEHEVKKDPAEVIRTVRASSASAPSDQSLKTI